MTTIEQAEGKIADINERYTQQKLRIEELREMAPKSASLTSAFRNYVNHGAEIDMLAIATEEAVTSLIAEKLARVTAEFDQQYRDAMGVAQRELDVARKDEQGRRTALTAAENRISGRNTPRWCVEDLMKAACAVGPAAVKEASTLARKHGLGRYVEAWEQQHANAA